MIEIAAIGGYSEVGKNMTALKCGDEAVIFDMGIHLENYIRLKGDDDFKLFSRAQMIKAGAIPDDSAIKDWEKNVKAIIPSHAHLDHIGAIPYMAQRYDAPIICTRYTAAVLRAIMDDKKLHIRNEIKVLGFREKLRLSESMSVEFISMTHSIPDTATVVLHTPKGKVVYANDFKLDNSPVLGEKPDYERLSELGKEGINLLIMDSLYADLDRKTPSESAAREMLREVMELNSRGKAVIITTFSSHIARLFSIIEYSIKIGRKPILLGRSLAKYVYAAENSGIISFSDKCEIIPYKEKIARRLKKLDEEREKYVIIVTGHQGEPDAVLSRIASGGFKFSIMPEDHVIFSCNVIPSPLNIANREKLEAKLGKMKARIFKDVHHSGHASREDHREILSILKPKNVIPAHAGMEKTKHLWELCSEMGINAFMMEDGKRISL